MFVIWILGEKGKKTLFLQKIIEEKLKGICKYAYKFKKRCLDFVARNKDKLTNAFVKLRNPKQACISLGFCK